MKDACGLLSRQRIFAHGGKMGDLMILFPGLKHIFDETGAKPIVVVSREFASIFDGISYAIADPVALSWWREVTAMRLYAESKYGECIVPKFWDDPTCPPPPPRIGAKLTTLEFMGRKITLAEEDWTSYQTAQWENAGFERQQMLEWPLVFDRRSAPREAELRKQFFRNGKPKLLVSIAGPGTSPFPAVPETMQVINQFQRDFEIVDLSRMRATRIYDLLGLYDHAVGLVTNDTATLHLAGASKVPYVAFLNNGGSGSVPRGNCVLAIRYANVMRERQKLAQILDLWKHDSPHLHSVPAQRPGNPVTQSSGGGNLAFSALAGSAR